MDRIKLTREEALRRWKASKELKRKMSEKLEQQQQKSNKPQKAQWRIQEKCSFPTRTAPFHFVLRPICTIFAY